MSKPFSNKAVVALFLGDAYNRLICPRACYSGIRANYCLLPGMRLFLLPCVFMCEQQTLSRSYANSQAGLGREVSIINY